VTILVPTAANGATSMPATEAVYVPSEQWVDPAPLEQGLEGTGIDAQAFADQLSAFATHERNGVQLYRSVAGRTTDPELRKRYEEFGRETAEHVEIYSELVRSLGGDPLYVSPAARATKKANGVVLEATFMLDGSVDAVTAELTMLDAVALAEAKCHANWEFLGAIASALDAGPVRDALEDAVSRVQPQEDEHLAWATSTRRELLSSLVLPGIALGEARGESVRPGDRPSDTGQLQDLTRDDLYALAQEQDIAGRSTMTKDELLAALAAGPDDAD
jgi:rubrerythrin